MDQEMSLVLSFDSDDPEFTRGFEAGSLWERMKNREHPIHQMFHSNNAEMAMRMAEAQGYEFRADDASEEWVFLHLSLI